jgi:hypothetical protein
MKTVVSVSLGSSRRDHTAEIVLWGTPVQVVRRGMDGNLDRAADTLRQLDGTVDALGLGGIDRYLTLADRRYVVPQGDRLARVVERTPVVDGSGIKTVWEPHVVETLKADRILRPGQTVLMVSAFDRYPMAAALEAAGLHLVCGDLMFAARMDYAIRSLAELRELGRKLIPEMVKLPFQQLYPVGAEQEVAPDPRFQRYFDEADVIAGDFHFIRRYLSGGIEGKVVLTTTTTAADVDGLLGRGAATIATTTPRLLGRTFGTNVLEAALVAASGRREGDPDWVATVLGAGLSPSVLRAASAPSLLRHVPEGR